MSGCYFRLARFGHLMLPCWCGKRSVLDYPDLVARDEFVRQLIRQRRADADAAAVARLQREHEELLARVQRGERLP
jgi:hypothetical protein